MFFVAKIKKVEGMEASSVLCARENNKGEGFDMNSLRREPGVDIMDLMGISDIREKWGNKKK